MAFLRIFLAACFAVGAATPAGAGPRLDTILKRGNLICGVAQNEPGMAKIDARGQATGFEADLCRAVAAALFGQPKVIFRATPTLQAFLADNDVDLVLRGLSWTFGRETANTNLRFGPTYFYDGQSFLTRADSGIRTLPQLAGKTVCVSSDAFADFYPALERLAVTRKIVLSTRRVQTRAEAELQFFARYCDAMTADTSELASAIIGRPAKPEGYRILGEQITKEPLSPLLRKGDDQFFDVVRWTLFALIDAEELGLTARNVAAAKTSADPDVKAFLTANPPAPGLPKGWSAFVVRTGGNYGEIFDRNLGRLSGVPRGPNGLPREGGLLSAPPLR